MRPRTTGQHLLPRFLLRGFAAFTQKKQDYTYLFRKDGATSTVVNILNAAKRRLFYGEPDETGIEDALAREESEFAAVVDSIRDSRCVPAEERDTLFKLIANLAIRTHHLRLGMSDGAERVFGAAQDIFTGKQAAAVMRRACVEDPSLLGRPIREAIRSFPSFPRDPRLRLSLERTLEELVLKSLAGSCLPFGGQVEAILQTAAEQIDWRSIARTSHIAALQKSIAPKSRVELCEQLSWSVVTTDPKAVILGDFGPLGLCVETGEWRPLSVLGKRVSAIVLPLAHDCLLLGYRGDSVPQIEGNELRRATAAHSAEFFIAAQDSETEAELLSLVGTSSQLLSDSELEDIKEGLVNGNEEQRRAVEGGHRISFEIAVDDTLPDGSKAARELKSLSDALEKALGDVGVPMETRLRIVVTSELSVAVSDVARGYGVEANVTLEGRSVAVCGKTVYLPAHPPLEGTIVVHSELWRDDAPESKLTRYHLFLSQVSQTLITARKLAEGKESTLPASPSFQEGLEAMAGEVLEVHDAHRNTIPILSLLVTATDEAGTPVGAGDKLAGGYLDSVHHVVRRLIAVQTDIIDAYRVNGEGLDRVLPAVAAPLRELFLVLAHMIGLAEDKMLALCSEALMSVPECRGLLADDWGDIVQAFRHDSERDAKKALIRVVQNVLARMGLYVDDLDDGSMDLVVGEPLPWQGGGASERPAQT